MNFGEGDELSERMGSLGHVLSASADDADIVILNTCTVVDTTEKKMIKRISDLKGLGKEVIVTGCMAKAQPQRIHIRLPDSIVLPPENYDKFAELVGDRYGISEGPLFKSGSGDQCTAILPIAQGCLGNCSYCITRIARGKLKSYPVEELTGKFKTMVERGAKEILVTAQDTGCYGRDIGTNLPKLISEFLRTEGEYRIRIGMMNPNNLGMLDELLDAMSDDRVYKFLHIPVQSGSDDILKRMNRQYTAEEFRNIVKTIRARYPDMSIATDIISGFPGESDDDHEKSVELISGLGAETVNVTRFSARPETPAFSMKEQIHGRVAKSRSRDITDTRSSAALEQNKRFVGTAHRALVTEKGKEGTVIARTGNYRPVAVTADLPLGEFIDIEITKAESTHLIGRMLNK